MIGYAVRGGPDTISARLAQLAILRRQRAVRQIYQLGPRVIFELIAEISRHRGIGDDVDQRRARYAVLDPAMLRIAGGDRLPAPPVHMVWR
jgi:hypothetical protein